MNQCADDLLQSPSRNDPLEAGYKDMAADQVRESEAMEWIVALAGDSAGE